jgi:hypothetical protein
MRPSCVQQLEELMDLVHTRIVHEGAGHWTVDFVGDDGEAVSVKVVDQAVTSDEEVLAHAKQILVELTAFGTRGAGPGVNSYDMLSNGNFDSDEPSKGRRH